MSSEPRAKRITTRAIRKRKGGEPIVCLTAYSAPMARMLDPHVDLLLIGDSLGNAEAGATDLLASVFPVGEDADASVDRTTALLKSLVGHI